MGPCGSSAPMEGPARPVGGLTGGPVPGGYIMFAFSESASWYTGFSLPGFSRSM
jgi:hypothetical protein